MKPNGNISLQILSKQFWQPTLDLCTIIESLELELINILCKLKKPKEEIFKKKVVAVRTANYSGKKKRQRRADAGRTAHWKKAIVRLAEGETFDLV